MIYIIKKDNFIYLTDEKRDLDSDVTPGELLLTSNKPKTDLIEFLRPYKDLDCLEENRYKFSEDILEFIKSDFYGASRQTYIYKKNIDDVIKDIKIDIDFLKHIGFLGKDVDINIAPSEFYSKVIYKCDIYNLILSGLSNESANILKDYSSLAKSEQDILKEFYSKPTKQEKLEYLRIIFQNGVENIFKFIPQWYKTNLQVFGVNHINLDNSKFSESPEYKDPEQLNENLVILQNPEFFIKKEVYRIFQIDEIWKGKDIKEIFKSLYEKLGTPKNSRVHDIFRYFEVAITRNGYRLISRKII